MSAPDTAPAARVRDAGGSRDTPYQVPGWRDPIAAKASGLIGGPAGGYAVIGRPGLAGIAAAVLLLGSGMLALGVWQKGHCLLKGWSTPDQYWRACYSDIPMFYVSSPLAEGNLPWSTGSNLAPLSGVVLWLLSWLSPASGAGTGAQQAIFVLWALVTVFLLAAGVLAVVALQPGRPWQATQLAVSPVLGLLAMVSTDLLGVALTLLALWAWAARRPWLCGVLLGLALLTRPFPLLVLFALVIATARASSRASAALPSSDDRAALPLSEAAALPPDDRAHGLLDASSKACARSGMTGPGSTMVGMTGSRPKMLALAQTAVMMALTAVGALVPLIAIEPAVLNGIRTWAVAEPGYGALQLVPQLLGTPLPFGFAVWVALSGWVLALLLGWRLATGPLRSPHSIPAASLAASRVDEVPALTVLLLLPVALTASSLSVQSGLWLLPFLALSGLRWRTHLIWAFAEGGYFVGTWLHLAYDSDPGRGLPPTAYAWLLGLRLVAWCWLSWQLWQDAHPAPKRAPSHNPRAPGESTVAASTSGVSQDSIRPDSEPI